MLQLPRITPSDYRGNEVDTCKLCLTEEATTNSHILSEFNYKGAYDSLHRILLVEPKKIYHPKIMQKGLREKNLLCLSCETKLSKWERYADAILNGSTRPEFANLSYQRIVDLKGMEYGLVRGADYAKFKLYLLTNLWRASVSTSSYFRFVRLGKHEELVRRMLLSGNPGDKDDYGCLMIAVVDKSQMFYDAIRQPDVIKVDGVPCFRFFIAGLFYFYFLPKTKAPEWVKFFFIDRTGNLRALRAKREYFKIFSDFLSNF